jgi:ABC-type glycerol-3-phosphate transport system substrate-binding protein
VLVGSAAAVSGAMGVLGAACGTGAGGGQPGTGTWSGEAVAIQLWDREEATFAKYIEAWTPGFASRQPRIKVEYTPRPPMWQEKLTAAMAGGTPPDVVAAFGEWFRTYQQQGMVISLDQYLKASRFDAEDFLSGVYKAMNWNGRQVAIPQYYNTNCVFYNAEYFRTAGVPLPAADWTQEQMADAARKLTRGPSDGREVWGLTMLSNWSANARVLPPIWARCGTINDPQDPNVFTLSKRENPGAFQWLHDLRWKERLAAGRNDERGGVDGRGALFVNGKAAMSLDSTAALATWKDRAQTSWDIAPMPRGPCGRGEWSATDGYVIPSGTKTADPSWLVVQGLTDKESGKLLAETTFLCPGRKSQFASWVATVPGKSLRNALPTDAARPSPSGLWPKSAEVTRAVDQHFARYFDDNALSFPDMNKQLGDALAGLLGAEAVK